MRRIRSISPLTPAAALGGLALGLGLLILSSPVPARADLSACGDIHVEAEGMCEVSTGIECEARCTTVSMRGACAARLQTDCAPGCTELPSAACTGECTASCEASCSDFAPGEFDCQGSCRGSCQADCSGRCAAAEESARCEASCTASCDASCGGSCDGVPPSASCEGGCEGSCQGSCDVDANFDCDGGCQAEGFAECEAGLEVECEASCSRDEGALFCDGHYVDDGGNMQACLDALVDTLNLMASGTADSHCTDGVCSAMAEGQVSSQCAVRAPGSSGDAGDADSAPAVVLLLLGAVAMRRRRTR